MSDPTPGNNKALAAGIAGSAIIIVAWVLDQFYKIQIPVEVSTAAQTLIVTILVWAVPHGGDS